MIKIEAIIRPSRLTALKDALSLLGVHGMTILEAGGFGRQRGHKELFRGGEYEVELIPKLMIVLVTTDGMAPNIVGKIKEVCYTGEAGDGKIFIYPIGEVIRIRTGEQGEDAL
ncbi:MAG: transcriptional regulator [Spirochaetes bacterium GWF1_49_6]|jgi:nitrogen regulatory protein P-II 1|nr:MAG: transcriptional regulator [Spirochaetes bacterium GWF1_49_6]